MLNYIIRYYWNLIYIESEILTSEIYFHLPVGVRRFSEQKANRCSISATFSRCATIAWYRTGANAGKSSNNTLFNRSIYLVAQVVADNNTLTGLSWFALSYRRPHRPGACPGLLGAVCSAADKNRNTFHHLVFSSLGLLSDPSLPHACAYHDYWHARRTNCN